MEGMGDDYYGTGFEQASANGVGEYHTPPGEEAAHHYAPADGVGDVVAGMPMGGMPMGGAPMGSYFPAGPVGAGPLDWALSPYHANRKNRAAQGVGQDYDVYAVGGVGVALSLLYMVARGAGGYYAGKAMRPSSKAFAWGGAALGLFTGPIGLGILGAVALSGRR